MQFPERLQRPRQQQVVIVGVCVGMLCGGAFGLSTIPLAVLAYIVPLAGGGLISLTLATLVVARAVNILG